MLVQLVQSFKGSSAAGWQGQKVDGTGPGGGRAGDVGGGGAAGGEGLVERRGGNVSYHTPVAAIEGVKLGVVASCEAVPSW
jgi:hypothetical protein